MLEFCDVGVFIGLICSGFVGYSKYIESIHISLDGCAINFVCDPVYVFLWMLGIYFLVSGIFYYVDEYWC